MILGIGSATIDTILSLEQFPEVDSKVRAKGVRRELGGTVANALVTASFMKCPSSFVGILGLDPDSNWILEQLNSAGIRTDLTARDSDLTAPQSYILSSETPPTRTVVSSRAETATVLDVSLKPSVKVLIVDHVYAESALKLVQEARRQQIPCVGDVERVSSQAQKDLIRQIDHLILNSKASEELFPGLAVSEKCVALWDSGKKLVAITMGQQGVCFTLDGIHSQTIPAVPVVATTTNGCGDVFHGAYASALYHQHTIADALQLAIKAAALRASTTAAINSAEFKLRIENL